MRKFFDDKLHHYAHHLVTAALVVFLFTLNFTVYNYASAAEGSPADVKVSESIKKTKVNYERADSYMHDYSVTWGELILGWEDFVVDTYYLLNE